MEYRVDREALAEFIGRQVELVEARLDPEAARGRGRAPAAARERQPRGGARALARRGTRNACRSRDLRGARALRHRARASPASRLNTRGEETMQTTEQPAYGIAEAERPLWLGQTPAGWADAVRTVDPNEAQDAASDDRRRRSRLDGRAVPARGGARDRRGRPPDRARRRAAPRRQRPQRHGRRARRRRRGLRAAPEPRRLRLLRRHHRLGAGALDRRRLDARRRSRPRADAARPRRSGSAARRGRTCCRCSASATATTAASPSPSPWRRSGSPA